VAVLVREGGKIGVGLEGARAGLRVNRVVGGWVRRLVGVEGGIQKVRIDLEERVDCEGIIQRREIDWALRIGMRAGTWSVGFIRPTIARVVLPVWSGRGAYLDSLWCVRFIAGAVVIAVLKLVGAVVVVCPRPLVAGAGCWRLGPVISIVSGWIVSRLTWRICVGIIPIAAARMLLVVDGWARLWLTITLRGSIVRRLAWSLSVDGSFIPAPRMLLTVRRRGRLWVA
jgi:hypothetical protein